MAETVWISHPNLTERHKTEVPMSSLWIYERSGWVACDPPEVKPLGVPTTLKTEPEKKEAASNEGASSSNTDTFKKTSTPSSRQGAKGESK